MKKLEEYVRSIPDFPEKGIIFRDITTVIQDPNGFHLAIDAMIEKVKDLDWMRVDLSLVLRLRMPSEKALFHAVKKANCLVKPSVQVMSWNTAPPRSNFTKIPLPKVRKSLS